jgi:DNA-binding NtrC family response regulator
VSAKANILIIDDDANTLASLARAFRLAGHEATVCDNAARALELAKAERFDLILSDVVMPGRDGIALLEDFKAIGLTSPVVMMSGQASIEMAVKATRLGASDFLEKPISSEKLLLTVENALRVRHLEEENRDLKRRLGRHHIVWASAAMKEVMAQVEHVAASETRVCIRGETGTGKELVARTLHEKSPRRNGPFVSLNCAAVPSELMETELFGHEKAQIRSHQLALELHQQPSRIRRYRIHPSAMLRLLHQLDKRFARLHPDSGENRRHALQVGIRHWHQSLAAAFLHRGS